MGGGGGPACDSGRAAAAREWWERAALDRDVQGVLLPEIGEARVTDKWAPGYSAGAAVLNSFRNQNLNRFKSNSNPFKL
jgi:hypothetical protein